MDNQQFDELAPEEQEIETKKIANKRLFVTFIVIDVVLLFYIIYSLIVVFSNL